MFRRVDPISNEEWKKWLSKVETNPNGTYSHLHLTEISDAGWRDIYGKLKQHFELAHADARKLFHDAAQISLDPIKSDDNKAISYPNSFPWRNKRGYFGEVFAGLVTFYFPIMGRTSWLVPAFLFRSDDNAEFHLIRLAQGEKTPNRIPHRTGNDFLALEINDQNSVIGFLVGEAKSHEVFSTTECKAAHKKIGEEGSLPVSYAKLKRILQDVDATANKEIIESISSYILNPTNIKRMDCGRGAGHFGSEDKNGLIPVV